MKTWNISLLVVFFLSAFNTQDTFRTIKNESFKKGEHLEYLVHYGLINAGTATVDVSEQYYLVNNRYCFKVDVVGKTSGAAGALVKVNDNWRTYLDTASFIPHRSYRNIEEGNFRRQEVIDFDPSHQVATMKYEQWGVKDPPEKRRKEKKNFTVPKHAQDIVSGYYYLRTIDFSTLKEGDIITIPGFVEDKLYDLKIRYKGRETVRTKFGKMNAHRLVPIIPKNGLFDGESSVRFWVSDDLNRVPVKIETDMFVGKVTVEITNFKNLKHKFNMVK